MQLRSCVAALCACSAAASASCVVDSAGGSMSNAGLSSFYSVGPGLPAASWSNTRAWPTGGQEVMSGTVTLGTDSGGFHLSYDYSYDAHVYYAPGNWPYIEDHFWFDSSVTFTISEPMVYSLATSSSGGFGFLDVGRLVGEFGYSNLGDQLATGQYTLTCGTTANLWHAIDPSTPSSLIDIHEVMHLEVIFPNPVPSSSAVAMAMITAGCAAPRRRRKTDGLLALS